ncbi:MAG: hypothetical protein HSCHL_1460 [Hydrogenibacillus schlegelii]|uniref:Uncharacterized protein n=1 Tax=Hydrogenibacillus schlegelii TaxID=1484 RepID=A0A2T5G4R0_HYDSH|nr:hypothetical protein [Hydrogenibacillus schlegelii]PTQ51168.1 MAG: hypothetical protein HSCHL_1460 [Hydrogenibacillus schlegelii]
MHRTFLYTAALLIVLIASVFTADRAGGITVGARTTAVIDGVTYVGVWREIEGKLMFFPDPAVNKGPCGAPYCVYVAEDNLDKIQVVRRDQKVSGAAVHMMDLTAPDIEIQQERKGSPRVTVRLLDRNTNPDDNRGLRTAEVKLGWTPLPGDEKAGSRQETGPVRAMITKGGTTPVSLNVDSLIRGPGTVTFDTDVRVTEFRPESPFKPFGLYDADVMPIMGLGKIDRKTVRFEFYEPVVSLTHSNGETDSRYTITNRNDIPFRYEAVATDVRGTVLNQTGTIGPGQTLSGTIPGPPSRTSNSNQTLRVTFFDPRGSQHLYGSAGDYYAVGIPGISLSISTSYFATGQTRKEESTEPTDCQYGPYTRKVVKTYRLYGVDYTVYSTITNHNNFPETLSARVGGSSGTYRLNGNSSTSGPSTSGSTTSTSGVTITGTVSSPAGSSSASVSAYAEWRYESTYREPVTCNPPPPPPPPPPKK